MAGVIKTREPGGPAPSIVSKRLQYVAFLAAVVASILIIIFRESLLPVRFLLDGRFLEALTLGQGSTDSKYLQAAMLYKSLGIIGNHRLAGLAGLALLLAALALARFRCRSTPSSWILTIGCSVSVVLFSIMLGGYSKDVVVVFLVLLVLLLPRNLIGTGLTLAVMVSYAAFYRDYWFIVSASAAVIWLLLPRLKTYLVYVLGLVNALMVSIALVVFLHLPADTFRAVTNESRDVTDVGSVIGRFVAFPDPMGGIVNNALTYLALTFPVPLALRGGAYYLGASVLIAGSWAIALIAADGCGDDFLARRVFAILVGFLSAQALFEPDYGSALRHVLPLAPLIVYLAWRSDPALQDRLRDLMGSTLSWVRLKAGAVTNGP